MRYFKARYFRASYFTGNGGGLANGLAAVAQWIIPRLRRRMRR